jgi:hypothetical protein
MTTPDELERAVKALTDMRDAARDGTPVTDPNEWEFNELTRILAAFHFLLSERAELLATVERMRQALWPFAQVKPTADTGFVNICALNVDVIAARAALTTGEDQ